MLPRPSDPTTSPQKPRTILRKYFYHGTIPSSRLTALTSISHDTFDELVTNTIVKNDLYLDLSSNED